MVSYLQDTHDIAGYACSLAVDTRSDTGNRCRNTKETNISVGY